MTFADQTLMGDISEVLGLPDMAEDERLDFYEHVGELIIESATLRYLVGLNPEEQADFQTWIDAHQENEQVIEAATERFPDFAEMLIAETAAFRGEAVRVMGKV